MSPSTPSKTFLNPVITGFNPDPSISRVGDDFFLTTSSFEYFPGLPYYHSKDLVNWELIGHALTRSSQLELRTAEPGGGIWAPTLRFRPDEKSGDGSAARGSVQKGRFYLAVCSWSRYRPKQDERIFPRGFYVYTDNIWDDKSWSDPVYFDNPGFDQDLFWDDDGKVYLSTTTRLAIRPPNSTQKDFAIHISEIDLPTGTTLTAPQVIRKSPYGIAEGSHIIKRGKYYYLFTAEGGTEAGHQEWVSRSEKGPLGPWELGPRNPLWYNGPDEEVQSTGHVDVFDDSEGNWWSVMLAVRSRKVDGIYQGSQLGRETFLVKVDWEDDWPVFNGENNVTLVTQGHSEKVAKEVPDVWLADLSQPELELGWYNKHTPLKPCYSLTARPGHLRIYGNCHSLSSPEAPALLLRKQKSFCETFSARLEFKPSRMGYEAGIVAFWNMHTYLSIGLTPDGRGGTMLTVSGPDSNDVTVTINTLESPQDWKSVLLELKGMDDKYYVSASWDGGSVTELNSVLAKKMIKGPEIGGAFAGMMWGVYSFGYGEPCLDPADFSLVTVTRNSD